MVKFSQFLIKSFFTTFLVTFFVLNFSTANRNLNHFNNSNQTKFQAINCEEILNTIKLHCSIIGGDCLTDYHSKNSCRNYLNQVRLDYREIKVACINKCRKCLKNIKKFLEAVIHDGKVFTSISCNRVNIKSNHRRKQKLKNEGFLSYHLPITEVTGRFAERLFNEESNTNLQMQEAVEIVARIVEEKENVKNLKDFRRTVSTTTQLLPRTSTSGDDTRITDGVFITAGIITALILVICILILVLCRNKLVQYFKNLFLEIKLYAKLTSFKMTALYFRIIAY